MRRLLASLLPAAVLAAGCLHTPPPHARALECNELCAQYIAAGDLVRADVQCDLGLQFAPQYADLWVNKGLIALKRNQTEVAKDHFIKALRYNQEQAQAYNNLGYIYLQDRSYGKAHDNFQRALKVNPDYTEARYNLALAYHGLKEKEKARKELRTLVAISPNLADPHHWLGQIALEEGDLDEAIAELHRTVELDPSYADAWMSLGTAYQEAGRFKECVDAYTACIEADPKHIGCRKNLPACQRQSNLAEPSLQEAKKNATGENTAASWFAMGRQYKDKGLRAEEERAYKKCVRLDSKYALCHFGLFEIFNGDLREKEATIACKNFLKFATAEEYPRQAETCQRYLGDGG